MHKAVLYQRSNGVQRRDAKQILDEHSHLFQWRNDGMDSLLDIGCGSGDVTIDFIAPLLPRKFARLVGVDLSEQMLRYARECYSHPNITFEKLDIGNDIEAFRQANEPFDHITSFYCLHWIQNQQKTMKNIYNLLRDDGDCLLTFLARNPIFEIYKQMSQNNKWAAYMTDVNKYISPYQYSKNPTVELEKILFSCGFSDYSVTIRDELYIYDGLDILKKSVKAVNPFLERIPADEHDNFLNDYVAIVTKMKMREQHIDRIDDYKFVTPYKLIVIYAKK